MIFDVVIVGAGIVGCTIARELSRYELRTIVVERMPDVAFGSPTKGNTGIIHAGYDDKPGTMKAKHCVRGNMLWHKIAPQLSVPFRRVGSMVIALKEDEIITLEELKCRGEANRVPGLRLIYDKNEVLMMEPRLNRKVVAALYAPTAAITSPYELAIAMAENAAQNDVKFLFETEVKGILVKGGRVKGVETSRGLIEADYLVNSAGLWADEISNMAGVEEFRIHPRKGEYYILDKKLDGFVRHILFPTPTPISKGIVVTPTVEGNIMVGPNAHDVRDKLDSATTRQGLMEVYRRAIKLVPGLAEKMDMVITSFCGLRPEPDTGDFMIKIYDEVEGFVNVAGIKSPGLTAAPSVALEVIGLLKKSGLKLKERRLFNLYREPIPKAVRNLEVKKVNKLISKDPRYGRVVCRCEYVAEGEVVEAIRRGATTLDGVKFRTRAGMGRCQGGFCTPHIIRILARELKIDPTEVTKKGGRSKLLACKVKAPLLKLKELGG